MFNEEAIFYAFKSRKYKLVRNIYEDKDFSEYYQNISNFEDSVDIPIYKKALLPSEVTLEIGSGNGRITAPLFSAGYNIYGIEPSKEMIKYIDSKLNDRIYNLKLQNISQIELFNINNVIIPGTSISLFSHEEIDSFLKYLVENQPNFKTILFDFLPISYFQKINNKIITSVTNNKKFYTVNFFDKSKKKVFFNIVNYKKERNKNLKIGISEKYLYSENYVKSLFKKYNIEYSKVYKSNEYIFIKGCLK